MRLGDLTGLSPTRWSPAAAPRSARPCSSPTRALRPRHPPGLVVLDHGQPVHIDLLPERWRRNSLFATSAHQALLANHLPQHLPDASPSAGARRRGRPPASHRGRRPASRVRRRLNDWRVCRAAPRATARPRSRSAASTPTSSPPRPWRRAGGGAALHRRSGRRHRPARRL